MKRVLCTILCTLLLSAVCAADVHAEQPIVKLKWAMTPQTAPIDQKKVMEALNKITREKLGVEVEIFFFDSATIQNAMQAGETYDMYFTASWFNNFNQAVSNGFFADITDKVKEWTPKLYATLPENIWNLAKATDGRLYAIPIAKDYAGMNFIVYDAGFAREHGIKIPERISSWDEMTDYLVAQKESMKPGEYPVMLGGSPAGIESGFDYVDSTALIGCEFGDTKIKSVFETEKLMERYRTIHKWMKMGLVNPDAATMTMDGIDEKQHFIKFVQAWPGFDYSPTWEYECGMTCFDGPVLNSDGVKGSMTAFSVTLEDDETKFRKALEYQEFVNTDKEYRDMLAYGIPGEHFNYADVKNDDGTVEGQVVIQTERGKSNYVTWGFAQGSLFIRSIQADTNTLDGTYPKPDMHQWEKYNEEIKNAKEKSAIGSFMFNTEKFTNELAEISAIRDEYWRRLGSGTDDPDVVVPKMLEKMNAAGLQDIIAEAQRQLDEYLAGENAPKAE